jgi:hypothetical protein
MVTGEPSATDGLEPSTRTDSSVGVEPTWDSLSFVAGKVFLVNEMFSVSKKLDILVTLAGNARFWSSASASSSFLFTSRLIASDIVSQSRTAESPERMSFARRTA